MAPIPNGIKFKLISLRNKPEVVNTPSEEKLFL
jgi:hypothetical protein